VSLGFIRPSRLREHGMLGMNCRNVQFINRYNDRALYPLVDNKLRTKLLAQDYDVPTPRLHFVVREQHEVIDIQEQLAGLDRFVLKPAKGSGGKGGRADDIGRILPSVERRWKSGGHGVEKRPEPPLSVQADVESSQARYY
jgi:hypothetical protein